MPKLHEVVGGAREASFPINNVMISLIYDPNQYTPEKEAIWRQYEREGSSGPMVVSFLAELVTWWDLEEDDSDENIKITEERLGRMSMVVLGAVLNGILADIQGGGGGNRAARRAQAKKPGS